MNHLRSEKFNHTIETLKEIEFVGDPEQVRQLYMYKVLIDDNYKQEARVINSEYKQGLMDPSRAVARIEV
jgi:hypothetical protein